MTVNIDTNNEEQIKILNEILAKYEQVEEHTKKLQFISIKELSEMMHCSLSTAQTIFNLPDFPSLDFAKGKIVLIDALKEWCMTKRSKEDYK